MYISFKIKMLLIQLSFMIIIVLMFVFCLSQDYTKIPYIDIHDNTAVLFFIHQPEIR